MTILCLFVRHGTTKYADALGVLDAWYDTQGLRANRLLWIIDNALPPGTPPQRLAPDVVLRAGDNSAWEFSAWAQALREARAEGVACELVHCVTSAFNTLYTGYLRHFFADAPRLVLERRLCLGHIDTYDRPVEFGGRVSASWVRTCFFFLPAAAAWRLEPWAAYRDPALFFVSPDAKQFRPEAPLSADYQRRIRDWLEGQEAGGFTWHSPVGATPAEVSRFQRKTLAILNEHSFAVTLRAAGLTLVDFCWLYTTQRRSTGPSPAIPDEQAQIAVRSRVLANS